jgi:hypothetical protein
MAAVLAVLASTHVAAATVTVRDRPVAGSAEEATPAWCRIMTRRS